MDLDIFEKCREINDLLNNGDEDEARKKLILLLDILQRDNIPYDSLINHLIREVGLFPYFKDETADWKDSLAYEMFKVDVGLKNSVALHREQSVVLKKLLDGQDLAVSAPTSFGKSFIIDAFIALKQPRNVVLIVPTIALMDETRRRLYKKFSKEYEIITQTDSQIQERNLFIFPPERALMFTKLINSIDLLIIDEFYKASVDFDKERAASLIKCILEFSHKAQQRYYIAPNISSLQDNPFTKGMEFYPTNFNTVFLAINEFYSEIGKVAEKKKDVFFDILANNPGKTLIYAGTFTEISKIKDLFLANHITRNQSSLLDAFSKWLAKNYEANWFLSDLVKNGIGLHNGRLHRSLAQIQVKLFEEENGLNDIISTSSIIEGVNTEAENVIIWKNKNGTNKLNFFTYKNIIGRSGRMLKHFVGKIFILDKTPDAKNIQLTLPLPQDVLINPSSLESFAIPENELQSMQQEQASIRDAIGHDSFSILKEDLFYLDVKKKNITYIIADLKENPKKWNGLNYLNHSNPEQWDYCLRHILVLTHSADSHTVDKITAFIKASSMNWYYSIPEILESLSDYDVSIEEFFKFEKDITYAYTQFFMLFNKLQMSILNHNVDISPFIARMKNAFLPPVVLQLEEFGLPRMIAKKIQRAGLINFEEQDVTIKTIITRFQAIGADSIKQLRDLDDFDKYIIDFFYDGITINA